MKAIIKTLDKALRINPTTGEPLEPFRPSVVTVTEFVTNLVMTRKVQPLGGPLPDIANDDDFLKFYKESDKNEDLAASSYAASLDEEMTEEMAASLSQEVEGLDGRMRTSQERADSVAPSPQPVTGNKPGQIDPKDGAEINGSNQATSAPAAKENK